MKVNRTGGLIGAGIVLASMVTTLAVKAAAPKQQLIATVNLLKIIGPDSGWTQYNNAINGIKSEQAQYKDIVSEFIGDGQTDAAIPPVDQDTFTKWLALKEKASLTPATLTDADKKALTDYENQGKAAVQQLTDLENKTNPSDQDKTTLAKLQGNRAAVGQAMTDKSKEYGAKFQDDVKKMQDALDQQMDDAVSKVAVQDGISYVFNAVFVSQLGGTQRTLMYSSDKNVDITDKVLKKLNGSK